MNTAVDISIINLALCFVLLIFPVCMNYYLKLGILRSLIISTLRMTLQLVLVGIFLKYLFELNHAVVNVLWVTGMIIFATLTTVKNSNLKLKIFFIPVFGALFISAFIVLAYFNFFVVNLDNLFDAKYLIAIGGMLLGNSLRSNIVALNTFYREISRNESRYLFLLTCGANRMEAVLPYFRNSMLTSFTPTIATMATMGLVALPGMMTGQILGGSSPVVSIKYQIAIMVAIAATMTISIFLSVLFSMMVSFTAGDMIKKDVITA